MKIAILARSRLWALLSLSLCAASVYTLSTRGLNFGIDFRGGAATEVGSRHGRPDADVLRHALQSSGIEASVQNFGPDSVLVRVGHAGENDSQKLLQRLEDGLHRADPELIRRRTDIVGPKAGAELVRSGSAAVAAAVASMALYVFYRFQGIFAWAAAAALGHDVLLTLGAVSFWGLSFDLSSVAALLTVIGFSMNDTVVIFDRIRENRQRLRRPLWELIDVSVNETFARTIVTSGTVMLALGSLLLFGGEALFAFAFTVAVGVIVGTYSSVCVAAPFLAAGRDEAPVTVKAPRKLPT